MRVIFSGGGTGGHIYPIMALIERLKERKLVTNDEILFVGTDRGLESKIVPAAGVPFRTLKIKGFDRKHPLKNFETIELFIKATKEAKQIIKDFKPDVVVGTGGYVSGAIVYEAAKMHVPTIIHESNSVVGLANKFLAHYVDKICYTFDDDVKKKLAGKKISSNVKIVPYIDNMPGLLPQMTCVVARSGATSLAEFTALGVPVILIPSPNVTHNHQMKNAMDMEKAGAALVIAEDDLNPNNFVSSIDHILLDTNYAKQMSEASKRLGVPDASDQVISVMEGLIKNK